MLDSVVQSAPTVNEPNFTDSVSITGNFTQSEAEELAAVLNRGAFPVEVEAQEARTVSPSAGSDSLQAAIIAGLVGLGASVRDGGHLRGRRPVLLLARAVLAGLPLLLLRTQHKLPSRRAHLAIGTEPLDREAPGGGLPLGLQIGGRPCEDALVLKAGDAYQGLTDHHLQLPPLVAAVNA